MKAQKYTIGFPGPQFFGHRGHAYGHGPCPDNYPTVRGNQDASYKKTKVDNNGFYKIETDAKHD